MISINYAHLADYAAPGAGGKPTFVGVFDTVHAVARTPDGSIRIPLCYLVVRLEGSIADAGEHTIELRLIDEDGRGVAASMRFERFSLTPSGPGRPLTGLIIALLGGLSVPKPCDYEFVLTADGREVGKVPFYVVVPPAPGS